MDRDYKRFLCIPIKPNPIEPPIGELSAYLQENGMGDVKLYNKLYSFENVYVKYWKWLLVSNGHHWREDDWNEAYQAIESVCEKYLAAAQMKQIEADGVSNTLEGRTLDVVADRPEMAWPKRTTGPAFPTGSWCCP